MKMLKTMIVFFAAVLASSAFATKQIQITEKMRAFDSVEWISFNTDDWIQILNLTGTNRAIFIAVDKGYDQPGNSTPVAEVIGCADNAQSTQLAKGMSIVCIEAPMEVVRIHSLSDQYTSGRYQVQ